MANPVYSNQSALLLRFGQTEVSQLVNLDGQVTLNTAAIQAALLYADSIINSQFFSGGIFLSSPGTYLTFLDQSAQLMTQEWANRIAIAYLYFAKSGNDENYKCRFAPLLKEAMDQMRVSSSDTKGAQGFQASRTWPVTNAPQGIRPLLNPKTSGRSWSGNI